MLFNENGYHFFLNCCFPVSGMNSAAKEAKKKKKKPKYKGW